MCGIAGAVGLPGAARTVRDALVALEYRGYDSCGVAWMDQDGLRVVREVGPVSGLDVPSDQGTIALGHTRWATHGGVTEENAHPHLDCTGRTAVVHNGVLLDHERLRDRLVTEGHVLRSDTDSECLAHMWEGGGPGLERLAALRSVLKGTYSIAILDADDGAVYVAKHRNPLWIAKTSSGVLLASDPVALRRHADRAVSLEDGDHGRIDAGGWDIRDAAGRPADRPWHSIAHLDDRADKAGYEHFMLKEIHETPSAMNRLLAAHLRQAPPYVELGLPRPFMRRFRRALALGAGTSFHAGLLGAHYMQSIAGVPATARPTPEYKDEHDTPEPRTLLLALSQSGETLDTLQALHRLTSHPHPSLALTNHTTSSIGRHTDHALALRSGIEVSVAATKTFLSQALLMYLLALAKGRADGTLGDAAAAYHARRLMRLPRLLERTLFRDHAIQAMARRLAAYEDVFLLAKGRLLPVAMEGALKLKEIAYQHAEAYAAGELKHGPFALLTERTAVVFLVPPGRHEASLRNSISEVAARGAPVFVVTMDGVPCPVGDDAVARLPAAGDELQPFVFTQAVHLLSYWTAKARGLPIDRPRNLAKSVTVE